LQLGEGGRLDGLGGQWRPTEGAGQRTDLAPFCVNPPCGEVS
jgi:hypothetical protein